MINRAIFLAAITVTVLSSAVFSQIRNTGHTEKSVAIMPVTQVREGMRGTARTVFSGARAEEFNVEILGVLPNWIGPKQDLIVGRLSGALAERTFVFAGMSGSPVYIDGKLVGAISYSFPFAKEPICGITPFEQMVSVVEQAGATPLLAASEGSARPVSFSELLSDKWTPAGTAHTERAVGAGLAAGSGLAALAGQTGARIATPVTFAGLSQATIDMFAPQLTRMGMLPVISGGSSGDTTMKQPTETTLLGGDSVIVHLARGDIQIAAAGTVTHRDGDNIYAFGHPFFSLGSTDLPMSESHVVTVVPNANNSFKLAVADSTVGSMTQDRATTIFGKLGRESKMLPVTVGLTTSRGRREEVRFESAIDPLLTPLIISIGLSNVLGASERSVGDATVRMTGEITIRGEQPIRFDRRFTGPGAAATAATAAAIPVAALLKADFEGLEISGIRLEMTALDGGSSATVERLTVDRGEVKAGEPFDIVAHLRTASGRVFTRRTSMTLPAGTAPGQVTILVGDGNAVQQNSAVTQFVPHSAAELISTVNRLKRPERLYAVITRTSTGAVVGASEMPNLPPSVLATMNNTRTAGGARPSVQSVLAEAELGPLDYVVSGSQTLTVEVGR